MPLAIGCAAEGQSGKCANVPTPLSADDSGRPSGAHPIARRGVAAPRLRVGLTIAAALAIATGFAVAQAPATIAKLPLERDIRFNPGDKEPLLLDVCKPPKGTKPYPVVVCVHGGSWQSGFRGQFHQWISDLAEHGYFAASIEYRLAPKHRFPAQVEDVKCAIRFLRSKAKEWDLDPDRFALMGRSAGGHLVLLAGLADGFEGQGGNADQSSKVRCIVNYMGPTDFAT